MILQCNPKASYLTRKNEIDGAVKRVLESGWYILGDEVDSFEREFAAYIDVSHAIGVASGTDALELAIRAGGIEGDDIVVTVSHTAVATAAAISRAGVNPLFTEIDPQYFTMDPGRLRDLLKSKHGENVKAIIVVHLYGQLADMPSILDIASEYDLIVIEDCAQAHGAQLHGKQAGAWGHFGCFSFYPTKNLGGVGDGGCITVNDESLASKVKLLREYGWRERYISDLKGTNSRLDELQAAILRAKLPCLDNDNQRRREIAGIYETGLAGTGLSLPKNRQGSTHVYHQYVVRSDMREQIRCQLNKRGIGTLVHYPVPIHRQPAFCEERYTPIPLSLTEETAAQVFSLPIYPELSNDEVIAVIDSINAIKIG